METESLQTSWYTICNPTSGGGIKQKKIDNILSYLKQYEISCKFIITTYPQHEEVLVQKAIEKGYFKFICIGGDGTIHHMINGIMKQKIIATAAIKLAVVPTGTGNDWIKNYKIPKDPKKAIQLVSNNKLILQDIGKIDLLDENKEIFFNNAAGIGFDAFVVKNLSTYKKWGALAYIKTALASFSSYKKQELVFSIDSEKKQSEIFMISIGICKYSGGGMQLTDFKNHKKQYFDFTLIKSITFFKVITQILKLYNGKISEVKETECSHIKKFRLYQNNSCYIQADGELIGKGNAVFQIVPNAIQVIVL